MAPSLHRTTVLHSEIALFHCFKNSINSFSFFFSFYKRYEITMFIARETKAQANEPKCIFVINATHNYS